MYVYVLAVPTYTECRDEVVYLYTNMCQYHVCMYI
jgi:hypothetical protein